MKILAIGDFHGSFPSKLEKKIREENPEIVLCLGDLADTAPLRDLEFKHWDKLKSADKEVVDIIGKAKYKHLLSKAVNSSRLVLRKLCSLGVPIYAIYGNSDTLDKEAKKYRLEGFESQCKRFGVHLIRSSSISLRQFQLIGFSGYRGAISKGITPTDENGRKKSKKINAKWGKRLKETFRRMNKRGKTVFIAHDVPFGYFDQVLSKSSPLYKKHVGDKYILESLKQHQPDIYLCGHMHEYQGVKNMGKTKVIAVGSAHDGKGAVIEYPDFKLRFIR